MRTGVLGSRRALLVLAALALLAAACGSSGDDGTATTLTSEGAEVGEPGGESSTTAGGGGGAGSTTGSGSAGGGGAASTGGSAGPTTSAASQGEVIGVGTKRVGEVAPALLRPGRGDRVLLEVRTQEGAAPTAGTLDHLARVLGEVSGKRVSVDGPALVGGGAREWTARDIVAAAAGASPAESGRTQVVLRLLFLRGSYEGDTGVLGIAVAGDVAAIFSDQVDSAAGVLVSPAVIEDAVTMHEAGHLLGLVDLLLGTGRGDPAHPGHSRNRGSVMYWKVESGFITQLLDGGIPRDFDADDRAELAQIRAG